jgi:restriction endonuclease S subunit
MDENRTLLSNIAEIRQGYQFRKKIEDNPDGSISLVQMTNIINGKNIDYQNLARTSETGFKKEHFLKKRDVLFCARGKNNYALLIDKDIKNTIAVSQFFTIRTNKTKLLPAYLVWYLAQPEAVAYFKSNTLMSTVPLINKKTIENFKLVLPPIAKQKIIADIYRLKEKEHYLIKQILHKKEKLINAVLLKSIKNQGLSHDKP